MEQYSFIHPKFGAQYFAFMFRMLIIKLKQIFFYKKLKLLYYYWNDYNFYNRPLLMSVLIETSFGDITVDLWTQKCPKSSLNFIKLCKMKHYNNALFIELQKNHITRISPQQEPTTIWQKVSKQQQDEYFVDEIDHEQKFLQTGLLVTANKGPNKNNSQFFITLTKADLSSLKGKHSVFGKVQQGHDVLRKINDSYCDMNNRPQMNIRILHTNILEDPFQDLQGMIFNVQSPTLLKDNNRLEAIEHLEMLAKYQNQEDIQQNIKRQKAKKQAVTLEMLGDLPDANIKPPENILFVCKLNPVTQQRDLQVIFSRFGPIKSVQINRDWKTGQSLQYAFIEFQTSTACEQAYLKMNNVLIDDRRIHVDFSQSVSKMMPRSRKPNQPQQKMVKQHEYGDKPQKIVKVGRSIQHDDSKYNLITSKPNYERNRTHSQRKVEKVRISQKELDIKKQVQRKRSQSEKGSSSSQKQKKQQKKHKNKQKSQKKQKKQKKRKRSRSNSSEKYSRSRSRDGRKKGKKQKSSKKQKKSHKHYRD